MKVLIADDAILSRRALSKIIEDLGYTVVGEAKNGLEAVQMYQQYQPDFITMDITMPLLNGIDALKKIIDFHPNAKIIMITSHGQEKMIFDALEAGASAYLFKPITSETFINTLKEIFVDMR